MDFKNFCNGLKSYFDVVSLIEAIAVGKFPTAIRTCKTPGMFYGVFFTWVIRLTCILPLLMLMYLLFVSYKILVYPIVVLLPVGIFKLCTIGNDNPKPQHPILGPVTSEEEVQRYVKTMQGDAEVQPPVQIKQGPANAQPTVTKTPNQNFPDVG